MLDGFITLSKAFINEVSFIYLLKNNVESIMLLSKIINEIKSRY